ncbi:26S proteasome non-ATPase regulatory subunit 8 [Amphibalanus amphitrite]|uniref:26S proteasome non-ATPase regulatory subunit 8 n=1 Tax=Amphibalanus amphitrite TaxID=1232801 RepID=A0A6A4WCL8_AMPAM|nr:26S proteasome non-ATPase regulatory subunit 8-like [Amphibalanus amphitrite]KAF0304385.1 26S proteasome non-ATPase regulatory subunit 8 [Amphibalanus amphitrite]
MASLNDVVKIHQSLVKEWSSKSRNLQKCEDLLTKAKLAMISLTFLPTSHSEATKQELIIARDVLEIGVQCAVERQDIPAFERYMAQLKCYYNDYKGSQLPESAYQLQLLGLNLLALLAQNRVGEFHTELELLPPDAIHNNVYIKYPVALEQYLMEGSYNKIFLAKSSVPAVHYRFFVDLLLATIREEIGACMEKAYERMSADEVVRMLGLASKADLPAFVTKRGWTSDTQGYVLFPREKKVHHEEGVASLELTEQTIEYARELEMIV